MKPTISLILSAFNAEKVITLAIQSILNQSFKDFEFIIVDDASQDSTIEKIKAFQIKDKRIRIMQNKHHIGLTKSLNKALKISKGKYIARQDADDYSAPERLEKQFNFLEEKPDIALVGTATTIIDDDGNELCKRSMLTDPAQIKTKLQKQNCIFHGSIMFNKKHIEKTGNYRELFRYGQDYDLYLRLSETEKISNINEPLYFWRFSRNSLSVKRQALQIKFGELARKFAKERTIKCKDSYSEAHIKEFLEKTKQNKTKPDYYEYQKTLLLLRAGKTNFKKKMFLIHPDLIAKYLYYLLKQLKKVML